VETWSVSGVVPDPPAALLYKGNDCIKQYWLLSNEIFRQPSMWLSRHSSLALQNAAKKVRQPSMWLPRSSLALQNAAKKVVRSHCHSHGGHERCQGEEELRQYDYAELDDTWQAEHINGTCKV
jgi:hypothetical protein